MINVFNLLQAAESFYKKALWSHFYSKSLIKKVAEDLLASAENFDIKDEKLFNQFEELLTSYKELIGLLKLDPANATNEAKDRILELIDEINALYKKINDNPYLNMNPDEGYNEDFDPGELSSFIQKIVEDVEKRLKKISGEDIKVSDIEAAGIANEFNKIQIDRGDSKLTYTGDKIQQLLEARRTWFKNLMFIKKVGRSHPEYHRYEKYIDTRHNVYKNIMSDPSRKETYRAKAHERQDKWEQAHPEGLAKRRQYIAQLYKQRKESGTLDAQVIHLQQKLATLKKDTAVKVKAQAARDPRFAHFKAAIEAAKRKMDQEPSPSNQTALEELVRKEAEELTNYLNNHPVVVKVREDTAPTGPLYSYRNSIKSVANYLSTNEAIPEEAKGTIQQLIVEGEKLAALYDKLYRNIAATIKEIVKILKSQL